MGKCGNCKADLGFFGSPKQCDSGTQDGEEECKQEGCDHCCNLKECHKCGNYFCDKHMSSHKCEEQEEGEDEEEEEEVDEDNLHEGTNVAVINIDNYGETVKFLDRLIDKGFQIKFVNDNFVLLEKEKEEKPLKKILKG